jgi:hypothetical protein
MKTLKQLLNESVELDNLAYLVTVLRGLDAVGMDDQTVYVAEMRNAILGGVSGMVNNAAASLKTVEQRRQLNSNVQALLKPMQSVTTLKQMEDFLQQLADDAKILGALNEAVDFKAAFQRVGSMLRKAGAGTKQWWKNNKYELLKLIVEFVLQLLLNIVFGLIGAMLKSKIEAPKIKMFKGFKGGDFGGGGAGSEWD